MTFSNIRLDDRVIQAVREAVDIVDIAGQMTTLKRAGKRYQGLCPFHKEKTPSFGVDPDQGLYYCFGCGAGGDAIKLYQEQTGDDFPAAIEALARRYGIPLPEPSTAAGGRPKRDVRDALEAAAKLFQDGLAKSAFARKYLDDRQISTELRQRYGLGYAPDEWRHLLDNLGRRFPLEDLLAAGLVAKSQRSGEPYDRFRQRLMFPIHAASGRLVGFGGRTLGDDRAKYINTAETEYFHKGNLLYGFHLAKRELREGGKALLVEGYFDVIGAAACGYRCAVAGMGTALTAEQARLLARYCDQVIVGYDGDEAGRNAHRKALPILLAAGLGVRRALFPAGHDPDSLRLEKGPEAVVEIVDGAEDAFELELDELTFQPDLDPRQRAKNADQLIPLLQLLRDRNVRHGYARLAAERLGINEKTMLEKVNRGARPGPRDAGARAPISRRSSPQAASRSPQEPPATEPETAAGPRETRKTGLTRTEEERALTLLLREGATVPLPEDLPPAEVFFDADCRTIYAAYRTLYQAREETAPTPDAVLAKLDPEDSALGRMAGLLADHSEPEEGALRESLLRLVRRWQQQRGPILQREILQAERQQDHGRLERLLEEKKALARSLHPTMTGRFV